MAHRIKKFLLQCGSSGPCRSASGMTLVEVVFAIAIAAIVSLGMYGSAIYTMRQTSRNMEQTYALQILNAAAAKARVARFDKLVGGNNAVGSGEFEKQFFAPQSISTDPNMAQSTSVNINYKLKGFGTGISTNASKYDLTMGEDSDDWKANEFKDRLLVIIGGKGVNQVMRIRNHTKTNVESGKRIVTAMLTSDLEKGTGTPSDWSVAPNDTSAWVIDYGAYCELTVTWGNDSNNSITETVYVPAR